MNFLKKAGFRFSELLHGFRNGLRFTNRFQIIWDRLFRRNIPLTHYIWKNRFYLLCNSKQGDHIAIQECLCDRAYDPLLDQCHFPSNRITYVNVGANVGSFDLLLGERGLVIEAGLAVELNPLTSARCLVNLQTNHLFSTQVVNAGIAGTNGRIAFNPSGQSIADSIFNAQTAQQSEATQVDLMTLETLLEKYGKHFQRFDLLKLDCEQAEYSILKSTPPEVLGKFRHIIIEFHPAPAGESVAEAQTKLKAAGFQLAQTLPNAYCPGFTSVFVRA